MSGFRPGSRMTFQQRPSFAPQFGGNESGFNESQMTDPSFVAPAMPSPVEARAAHKSRTLASQLGAARTPGGSLGYNPATQQRPTSRFMTAHTPGLSSPIAHTPMATQDMFSGEDGDEYAANITLLDAEGGASDLSYMPRNTLFSPRNSSLLSAAQPSRDSPFSSGTGFQSGDVSRGIFSAFPPRAALNETATSFSRAPFGSTSFLGGNTSGLLSSTLGGFRERDSFGGLAFGRQEMAPITERFKEKLEEAVENPFERTALYKDLCDDQIRSLDQNLTLATGKFQRAVDELKLLKSERDTWLLLERVYSDRFQSQPRETTRRTFVPFDSDKVIAQRLVEDNVDVRAAQLVVKWLEETARAEFSQFLEKTNYYESSDVGWTNTLHLLASNRDRGVLVPSLDPDAPQRTGRKLAEDDDGDERRLVKKVFTLLRLGEKQKARLLCRKCGQHWRAATLAGGDLFHDENMETEEFSGNIVDMEGNFTRDVWRKMCWSLSSSDKYDIYERAVYAALSGNIDVLLQVCMNWHDALWAHFTVLLDSEVEDVLRQNPHPLRPKLDPLPRYKGRARDVAGVFTTVASSSSEPVSRGARELFHRIQSLIIQANIPAVIECIHREVKIASNEPYFRFFAHLALFFRELCVPSLPEEACEAIIHEYVKYLIKQRDTEVVATYVARLKPETAIKTFSDYLVGITDKTQRLRCLELARDAGLDVAGVTKQVVTTTVQKKEADVLPNVSALNFSLRADRKDQDVDAQKISALDWLVFDPSQRAEALVQGNTLMRTFLLEEKLKAATDALLRLPTDSADVVSSNWRYEHGDVPLSADLQGAIVEYIALRAYIESQHALQSWRDHQEHKDSHGETEGEENPAFKVAVQKLFNVVMFPEGWLGGQPDGQDSQQHGEQDESQSRFEQMQELRKMVVPQCILDLLDVYLCSELYYECHDLAVLLAEDEGLSTLLRDCKDDLVAILDLLGEASLKLLEKSQTGDPCGFS